MPKEFPEKELIRRTFVVRDLDLPPSVLLTKKSMVRWLALSLGLISERESRDTILEILDTVFSACFSKKEGNRGEKGIDADTVHAKLKEKGINVTDKLVRYHLKGMVDTGFLEKKGKKYFLATAPNSEKSDVTAGFKHNLVSKVNSSLERTGSVLEKIMQSYG